MFFPSTLARLLVSQDFVVVCQLVDWQNLSRLALAAESGQQMYAATGNELTLTSYRRRVLLNLYTVKLFF